MGRRFLLSLVFLGAGSFATGCDARVKNAEVQADAHADLAREAFQRGDARRALDEAQTAVSFDDSNARAHALATASLLALCAGDEGTGSPDCRLDLAEKHARKTLTLEPTDRNARNTLGSVLLLERSRGAEALEVLRPLTQDPAFASAHLAWANYGWAQLQVGNAAEAVESLRRAVREPRFCVGWYRLAVAYEAAGRVREAEESVSRAVSEKLPECQSLQDAWKFRGELRAKQGKSAEATADFEACERLAPHTPSGRACAAMRAGLSAESGGKAS
jgi:type IV pilus assembly protein PilF